MIYTVIIILAAAGAAYYFYKRKQVKDVPQGLQCFNPDGGLILDLTDTTLQIFGTASTGTSNGSIKDSRINAASGFVFPIDMYLDGFNPGGNIYSIGYQWFPQFSIKNGEISWTYVGGAFWTQWSGVNVRKVKITFAYGGRQ